MCLLCLLPCDGIRHVTHNQNMFEILSRTYFRDGKRGGVPHIHNPPPPFHPFLCNPGKWNKRIIWLFAFPESGTYICTQRPGKVEMFCEEKPVSKGLLCKAKWWYAPANAMDWQNSPQQYLNKHIHTIFKWEYIFAICTIMFSRPN